MASLGARWVLEAWFDPARAISSLLAAAVVVTEFLWSNSTVQISKDISPLHAATFCVIYLFTNGWFILTRWEGNCGNPLLGMVGGFSIPAWFAATSWYQNSPLVCVGNQFCRMWSPRFSVFPPVHLPGAKGFVKSQSERSNERSYGEETGVCIVCGITPLPISRRVLQQRLVGVVGPTGVGRPQAQETDPWFLRLSSSPAENQHKTPENQAA